MPRVECHLNLCFSAAAKEDDKRHVSVSEQFGKCMDEFHLNHITRTLINPINDEKKSFRDLQMTDGSDNQYFQLCLERLLEDERICFNGVYNGFLRLWDELNKLIRKGCDDWVDFISQGIGAEEEEARDFDSLLDANLSYRLTYC